MKKARLVRVPLNLQRLLAKVGPFTGRSHSDCAVHLTPQNATPEDPDMEGTVKLGVISRMYMANAIARLVNQAMRDGQKVKRRKP